jgi:hypothetical protein
MVNLHFSLGPLNRSGNHSNFRAYLLAGHRSSIARMICSAHRIASAMALMVAGTHASGCIAMIRNPEYSSECRNCFLF